MCEARERMMKATFLVLIVVSAAMAFGQTASVASNQPQVFRVADHPMHAENTPLASERSLIGGGPNTYTYAQGERPLWEFGPFSDPARPLGDVARDYRKEKQTAKKAEIILEKQGS
jgi:hypothetical protein